MAAPCEAKRIKAHHAVRRPSRPESFGPSAQVPVGSQAYIHGARNNESCVLRRLIELPMSDTSREDLPSAFVELTTVGSSDPAPIRANDATTLRRMARRSVPWIIGGGVVYLLAPSVLAVLAASDRLVEIDWYWMAALLVCQGAVLYLTWVLQRLLIQDRREGRPPLALIASTQLVGNAVATVAPFGGAAGTAAQVRALARRGVDPRRATAGIVAFSLLQVASIGALALVGPVMVILGVAVPATLGRTALLGCAALGLITALLLVALRTDRAADWVGIAIGFVLRRDPKRIVVMLRRERRHLRRAMAGPGRAPKVLGVALARSIADYACLLAAVAAVSPTPRPAFVLLAFVAAAVLRLIPLTPGGLGPVEAALIPLLAAASTTRSGAVLATLAYRMASLWIPLLLAAPAMWWLQRHTSAQTCS
jgi:uncharacterized protein (TIRG00374 family)